MRFTFLLPFWYPFLLKKEVTSQPKRVDFFSRPFLIYKNIEKNYTIHSDICPHQGASLSKGYVDEKGRLNCPYHGFQFENGYFCNIPGSKTNTKKSKIQIKYSLHVRAPKEDDLIFVFQQNETEQLPNIYYPPEKYNSSFRSVSGTIKISTNYMSVCENLLDMLHISYVHHFGSKQNPLPYNISFENLSEYHGRSIFLYKPNPNTISGKLGRTKEVKVENEYILPTNTITRVTAGNIIKTVFTRSIPVSENETILHWTIYRNFLLHSFFDFFMQMLMEKTLEEDVSILKNVYSKHRNGIIKTKYDKTILKFRKACKKFEKKIGF